MDAGYSNDDVPNFVSPVGFRAFSEAMMGKNIMMMAGKVKRFVPPPFEAAAAAETNDYSAEDAMRAFNQISGDSGVLEFHSIVGKLPIDDLKTLEKRLEEPYHVMKMIEYGISVYADVIVPDLLRSPLEPTMRKYSLKMADKVKSVFPTLVETANTEGVATAAEINYSVEDAVRALRRMSGGGDSGVVEFQSIVGKLPIDDHQTLEKLLEEQYHVMRMFPDDADDIVPDRLRSALEPKMRKKILKMAGKVKGIFPTLVETASTEAAATAAETNNYSVEDAVRALRRMSGDGDSGVVEFQSIVGKLPIDDLKTLEKLLEEPYHVMLRSEMGLDYNPYPYLYPTTWRPEVKAAASGGGDSFMTKFAGQAIGAMLTKVVGGAVFGAFDPTTVEPFELEKAMGAMGLMSVIGGMVVQDKKPGLSRAMLKFGSVAIALAMIGPMAGSLENVIMAWVFAVLAAAIVAVTATFA